ncbi:hypothetical protein [Roseomonas fluvialis]|uniref:hypothetical protein n=1 Tax=Roseomonas fluvialis TaxID=1750527 RepID=UPI001FCC12A8|nr:hypothetical protein [Roseomonas fluvialis]
MLDFISAEAIQPAKPPMVNAAIQPMLLSSILCPPIGPRRSATQAKANEQPREQRRQHGLNGVLLNALYRPRGAICDAVDRILSASSDLTESRKSFPDAVRI